MPQIKALSDTLRSVAAPGMTPKALRAAVREKHPDATKKDIVRAAFYALTEEHSQDLACLAELHGFALVERVSEDERTIRVDGHKKKRRQKPVEATPAEAAQAAN
jgi:site-specific recombinase XerC